MQTKINAVLVGLALATASSLHVAAHETPMRVEIKYDRTAPISKSYSRALSTARKACQVNGRLVQMKRYLEETCVAPIVASGEWESQPFSSRLLPTNPARQPR